MGFDLRGTGMSGDLFEPPATYPNPDYHPDWYRWTQDLNINFARVMASSWVATRFNIKYYPDWAVNLDALLTEYSTHGVTVNFGHMGNMYRGTEHDHLGLIQADRRIAEGDPNYYSATPLADAKILIDKLAGDTSNSTITTDNGVAYGNTLGKNFLTDPRVWGYAIANEPDITVTDPNSTSYLQNPVGAWYIPLLDYIRSKGGKTWVGAPYDANLGYLTATECDQIFGDHVDVIELHYYGESEYVQGFNSGTTAWESPWGHFDTLYDYLLWRYKEMVSVPRFPPEKCVLGEFGCWYGYGNREGLDLAGITHTFTNAERMEVFGAHLNAARDAGVKNLTTLTIFGGSNTLNPDGTPKNDPQNPNYGICYPSLAQEYTGFPSYIDPNLATLIRNAYASPTPATLPFTDSFTDLLKWQIIDGTWKI